MKRICLTGMVLGLQTVVVSLAFANAPISEAQPSQMAVASTTDPVTTTIQKPTASPQINPIRKEQSKGFHLSDLPQARWKDASVSSENARSAATAPDSASTNDTLAEKVHQLTELNIASRLSDMQQQITELRGQLEEKQKSLDLIKKQQNSFYENIEQKIQQLQAQINSSTTNGLNGHITEAKNITQTQSVTQNKAVRHRAHGPVVTTEAHAYQAALNQLMSKQYAKAQRSFMAYNQRFPKGHYRGHVSYWLGEIALLNKNYPQAESYFQRVINDYPNSGKLPDARYKLAVTHIKTGQSDLAKKELLALKKAYPGQTIARLASLQIQQLQLDLSAAA